MVLRDQGFGSNSADALADILSQSRDITVIDMSMNNLHLNFEALSYGLAANDRLVALKLQNNCIDGRKHQQELIRILLNHRSLTSLDLGNSEAIKNRNRINNDGLIAISTALFESDVSLLSHLSLQSCGITNDGISKLGYCI